MKNRTLPSELMVMLVRKYELTVLVCSLTIVISAIAVVYAVHLNRRLYSDLEKTRVERDLLESEYEKLVLERSAWSDLVRVEDVSANDLAMKVPKANDIVLMVRHE